jgi:hypothetical protein
MCDNLYETLKNIEVMLYVINGINKHNVLKEGVKTKSYAMMVIGYVWYVFESRSFLCI